MYMGSAEVAPSVRSMRTTGVCGGGAYTRSSALCNAGSMTILTCAIFLTHFTPFPVPTRPLIMAAYDAPAPVGSLSPDTAAVLEAHGMHKVAPPDSLLAAVRSGSEAAVDAWCACIPCLEWGAQVKEHAAAAFFEACSRGNAAGARAVACRAPLDVSVVQGGMQVAMYLGHSHTAQLVRQVLARHPQGPSAAGGSPDDLLDGVLTSHNTLHVRGASAHASPTALWCGAQRAAQVHPGASPARAAHTVSLLLEAVAARAPHLATSTCMWRQALLHFTRHACLVGVRACLARLDDSHASAVCVADAMYLASAEATSVRRSGVWSAMVLYRLMQDDRSAKVSVPHVYSIIDAAAWRGCAVTLMVGVAALMRETDDLTRCRDAVASLVKAWVDRENTWAPNAFAACVRRHTSPAAQAAGEWLAAMAPPTPALDLVEVCADAAGASAGGSGGMHELWTMAHALRHDKGTDTLSVLQEVWRARPGVVERMVDCGAVMPVLRRAMAADCTPGVLAHLETPFVALVAQTCVASRDTHCLCTLLTHAADCSRWDLAAELCRLGGHVPPTAQDAHLLVQACVRGCAGPCTRHRVAVLHAVLTSGVRHLTVPTQSGVTFARASGWAVHVLRALKKMQGCASAILDTEVPSDAVSDVIACLGTGATPTQVRRLLRAACVAAGMGYTSHIATALHHLHMDGEAWGALAEAWTQPSKGWSWMCVAQWRALPPALVLRASNLHGAPLVLQEIGHSLMHNMPPPAVQAKRTRYE